MTRTVRDVMTGNPTALSEAMPLGDVARTMRDRGIGDVIVVDLDDRVRGIATDRDIVVRAVAEECSPSITTLGEIVAAKLTFVTPSSSIDDAVLLMRARALRRLPVLDDGKPVGIVSLGDVTIAREPCSMLADISSAPSNV